MSIHELPLNYTYYQLFVEFLVNQYGLNTLQNYLKRYIEEPQSYKRLFGDVYGCELDSILVKFNLNLHS